MDKKRTRSVGEYLRCLIAFLVLSASSQAMLAQESSTSASDLFRQGDYEMAAKRWDAAAKAGSAVAMFRLAQMRDLGLGLPRDPDLALKGYIAAGLRGHTVAQFNAAAMFDIGVDTPRDARRAAFWYSLAATKGHARSAYDLGRLFARGDGVPRNFDLARHWLDQAAPTLAAAARERAQLGPDVPQARPMTAPRVLGANVMRKRAGWRVDLVWTAPPGPIGTRFFVELVTGPTQPGGGGQTVAELETEASVATFDIGQKPAGLVWRVSRVAIDRSNYASSQWAVVASKAGRRTKPLSYPRDRVTIRFEDTDAAARRLAEELSRTLLGGGVWNHVEDVAPAPTESTVVYRYATDLDLASGVASSLPAFDAADARQTEELDLAPGEIIVTLVGGPAVAVAGP